MKATTIFDQVGFPQVVGKEVVPQLGEVNVYEDGSLFNEKTGQFFAPQQDDQKYWSMRQQFDKTHSITPSERILTANRERSYAQKSGFYC
jgi:hypothetical protein